MNGQLRMSCYRRRNESVRTGLRDTTVSVVGSRRLLTHMCAPGRRGSSWGRPCAFAGSPSAGRSWRCLLVPLVSLTAIWGFATVLTGREVNQLFDTTSIVEKIGYPTEDVVSVLQHERRQTLVYLADPRASDALAALRRTRTATDEAVSKIRRNAKDPRRP